MVTIEATTLSTFLESAGTVITQMWSWVSTVAETVVSTPIYFVPIGIFLAGAAVGLFKRLFRAT